MNLAFQLQPEVQVTSTTQVVRMSVTQAEGLVIVSSTVREAGKLVVKIGIAGAGGGFTVGVKPVPVTEIVSTLLDALLVTPTLAPCGPATSNGEKV